MTHLVECRFEHFECFRFRQFVESFHQFGVAGNLHSGTIQFTLYGSQIFRHSQDSHDGSSILQTPDTHDVAAEELKVVTRKSPDASELADLIFAWRVAKYVKSNAIVYCADGRTLGIGAGQMSRVDSTRIAALKAANAGLSLAGSVVASDAFFPFRDGLDVVADNGAVAVIQPGGSVRDQEVIAAADERGLAMVFTGIRHFRH